LEKDQGVSVEWKCQKTGGSGNGGEAENYSLLEQNKNANSKIWITMRPSANMNVCVCSEEASEFKCL
jgi:hypothetical protein